MKRVTLTAQRFDHVERDAADKDWAARALDRQEVRNFKADEGLGLNAQQGLWHSPNLNLIMFLNVLV